MAGFGERIGDAYVRVHASGEHLGDDVAAQFKGTEKEFEGIGAAQAEAEGEGFRKKLRKDRSLNNKAAVEALRATSRQMFIIGEESGSRYFKGLRKVLSEEVRDSNIGAEMARTIEEQFVRSGGKFSVVEKIISDPQKLAAVFERSRIQIAGIQTEAIKMNRAFDATQEALRAADQEAARLNKTVAQTETVTRRAFQRSNFVLNFNRDVGRLGDTVGRVFGKGSRSEFLNFFGRLAGSLTKLAFLPLRITGTLFDFGRALQHAGSAAGGSLTGFARIGSALASLGITLPAVAAGFAALGVAFAALLVIIGPLVAGLSLLAGIVVALAGSAFFALIAGVGSLVAVLLPAAAAVGVLVAGLTSLDDKSKKMLQDSVRPMVAEFKRLGVVAREGLLSRIGPTVTNLTKAFRGLGPLVKGVAEAVADVGLSFSKSLNSPGFRAFRDAMAGFLPDAIRKLGEIAKNTLGGFGGLFVGMIPFMNRVLRGLEGLTQRFSDFANSAGGQRKIERFFERAEKSARSFGGFLKEVGGLILDLFTAGQGTGDNLFTSMEKSIAKFRKFIKSDPDILRDWFNSAEKFGKALGRLIVAAGQVLDALDSPSSRTIVTFFADLAAVSAKAAAAMIKVGEAIPSLTGLGAIGTALGGANGGFTGLLKSFAEAGTGVGILKKQWDVLRGAFKKPTKPKVDDGDVKKTSQSFREMRRTLKDLGFDADRIMLQIRTDITAVLRTADTALQGIKDFGKGLSEALNPGTEGKDGIAEPFRKGSDAVLAFENNLRRILGLPPIKPRLDRSEILRVTQDTLIALDALRLLDIFDGGPEPDRSKVKALTRDILDALRQSRILDLFKGGPAPDRSKVKALIKDINTAIDKSKFLGLFRSGPKPSTSGVQKLINKINEGIRRAKQLLSFNFGGGGRVDVGRSRNSIARGGLVDALGNVHQVEKMATGGFANFRQFIAPSVIAGEAGREAVVPIDRPLSLVDPSVRALAAFAQGRIQSGSSVGVDASGWTIMSNSDDPATVAREALNRLTAAAY